MWVSSVTAWSTSTNWEYSTCIPRESQARWYGFTPVLYSSLYLDNQGERAGGKIRRDCVVCRRNRAQPGEQMMVDLIASRLDNSALPFTRTAVDLFGHLEIGTYRNRTAKRWGIITHYYIYASSRVLCFWSWCQDYRLPISSSHSESSSSFIATLKSCIPTTERILLVRWGSWEKLPRPFIHLRRCRNSYTPIAFIGRSSLQGLRILVGSLSASFFFHQLSQRLILPFFVCYFAWSWHYVPQFIVFSFSVIRGVLYL